MHTTHERLLDLWPRKRAEWDRLGLVLFDPTKLHMEILPNPQRPHSFFLKFFNECRPTRGKPPAGAGPALSPAPSCGFDDLANRLDAEDQVPLGDRYVAVANMMPSQPWQVLVPLRMHRASMRRGDLAPIIRASKESGYHFGASKRGSGIGRIADHFHFQAYITPMPVVTYDYRTAFDDGRCAVGSCAEPYFVLRLEHPDPDAVDLVLAELTREHPSDPLVQWLPGDLPYNVLVAEGVVYIVPRTAELPTESRWVPFPGQEANDNWKFGCAELAGLFFPRTLEQHRGLTEIGQLTRALRDVTLTDPSRQADLAAAFIDRIRELS